MPHKDKEIRRAYNKAYRLAHPEITEREKVWKLQHPEQYRQKRQEWYKSLTVQQKLNKQDRSLELYRQLKLEVLNHYGLGKLVCVQCGESRIDCLSIDHINGGGNAHRRTLGNDNIFRWLKRNNLPLGFRTLCMNCQFCNKPKRIVRLRIGQSWPSIPDSRRKEIKERIS